jgi:hypothetical protein
MSADPKSLTRDMRRLTGPGGPGVRRAALAAGCAALLALAACAGGEAAPVTDGTATGTAAGASVDDGSAVGVHLEPVEESAREDVPSALDDIDSADLPEPLVDPKRVISGGPPPDGIPPIDAPRFVPAGDVDWLSDEEPVLAVSLGGDERAYPVRILVWHEIVNDTVGGVPVAVTYCPLCTSALAFDRRVGDRLVTFGTSGKLYLSDLVMYDRQTESLWSQLGGEAIAGVLAGTELDRLPVQTVAWSQWREAHPDGWVLSRDTGVVRDYGRNPYVGYDDPDTAPFLFDGEADPRLAPKARVLALGQGEDPVAVPLEVLADKRVLTLRVAGTPVVAFAVEGLRSALDAGEVDAGREIAATGAFRPEVDGRTLTFSASGPDRFVDAETGSTWTVLGEAVDGPLAGAQLTPAGHVDTFWFAWAAFQPETRLAGG